MTSLMIVEDSQTYKKRNLNKNIEGETATKQRRRKPVPDRPHLTMRKLQDLDNDLELT